MKRILTAIAVLIYSAAFPQSFTLDNLYGTGRHTKGRTEYPQTSWLLKSLSVTETENGCEVTMDEGPVVKLMYVEEPDTYSSHKISGTFRKLTPKDNVLKDDWSVHYRHVPAGCEGRLEYIIIISRHTWKSEKFPERNATEITVHVMCLMENHSYSASFTLTPEEWEAALR